MPRFQLGKILSTPGATMAIPDGAMIAALRRHAVGDWGLVDPEDKAENDLAIEQGFRILSVYEYQGIRFWIETNADRSATTVLMPSEY